MKLRILTVGMVAALLLNACTESPKKENVDTTTTATTDDINKVTSTDKDGKNLDVVYNNSKGTATVKYDGQDIELTQQQAASGIWYKNDQYELRGKGNDIELLKDGKVVFVHNDDIVNTSVKDDKDNKLHLTFNNSENTVKVYLNSGEQIDLKGEKPASGIWYKNDHYELRGKGEKLELKKDDKTVFKNYTEL